MEKVFYFDWEATYMVFIQHLGDGTALGKILDVINNIFSFCGEEYICIAIMGLLYWGFNKEKGRRIGLIVIATNIANGMFKNIARRARPYKVLDNVDLLRDVDGYSFPSGHSANSAAIYASTAYEYKEKKWLKYIAIFLPILVAISRNRLGAHWPTDVLFGLLQGALVFAAIEFLAPKVKNKYIGYIIILAISLIGIFYCNTDDYFNSLGMLIGFVAGIKFEETFVNFENTNKIPVAILRTIIGGALYVIINTLLKKVIGGIFPEATMGYFLMRTVKYAIILFLLIGVYPMTFKLFKKNK